MADPLVSIITPSYNSAAFLEQTILGVAAQTYRNIEYIIVDGGSTDGTVDIIKQHAGTVTKWVSEKDGGQADALRKGLEMASGEILAWVNSDDVYPPIAVQTAVTALEKSGADVVYGNRGLIDADGRWLGERRLSPFLPYFSRRGMLYGGFGVYQPAAFWTKRLYDSVGGVDPTFRFAMDTDLFVKFALAGARFKFIRRELVYFRVHEASKTSTIKDTARKEWASISSYVPPRPAAYKLAVRSICRAWRLGYDIVDTGGRYQFGRLKDKYRFVP
ncbi:MAG: glycosyltransferase [SAR202 cluster bacterium]|nr:glycosyltransferase [SAR202 cluster bacterium]